MFSWSPQWKSLPSFSLPWSELGLLALQYDFVSLAPSHQPWAFKVWRIHSKWQPIGMSFAATKTVISFTLAYWVRWFHFQVPLWIAVCLASIWSLLWVGGLRRWSVLVFNLIGDFSRLANYSAICFPDHQSDYLWLYKFYPQKAPMMTFTFCHFYSRRLYGVLRNFKDLIFG